MASKGTFDSPYDAEITAKLANGKSFTYKQSGTFKSVTYVDAVSKCKTMPVAEMPTGVQGKKGMDVSSKRAVRFRG